MQYSAEQRIAFHKYNEGKNVFLTGPGGTGKTALIKYLRAHAMSHGIDLQVCAMTGCAAVLLQCKAKTVHSWAKIGIANGSIEKNVRKVTGNFYARAEWKKVNVLVIDEVSMMSRKMFEMLDAIAKACRRNSRPFGGIQMVLSGDFYQLPPVGTKDEPETLEFCFQSPLWGETFKPENHVQLTKIFRQTDETYQNILNQIRVGRVKRSSNERLLKNVGRVAGDDVVICPTKLFPTRNKVESLNATKLCEIDEEEFVFNLKVRNDLEMTEKDRVQRTKYTSEQINLEIAYLKSNLRCDPTVILKRGAQVMCIVNMELSNGTSLCNGSQGVVVEFNKDKNPIIEYSDGQRVTMTPHVWPSENIPGIGISQVPLILAWALTIHKSQGATLECAEVDVGSGIFECGQTYVALSRVKSLDGLYLTSFDVSRININKHVQDFYNSLPRVLETPERLVNMPDILFPQPQPLPPVALANPPPIAIATPAPIVSEKEGAIAVAVAVAVPIR